MPRKTASVEAIAGKGGQTQALRQARLRINLDKTGGKLHAHGGIPIPPLRFSTLEKATYAYTGNGFVTVVSADFSRACIDGALPFTKHVQARTAFRGDTIFTLDQVVIGRSDRATFVKAYIVDTSNCDWIRLRP